ncbi:MAG: hypothetical protein WAV46_01740 [Candidatus Moraniibacteriota bacterium]
MNHLSAFFELMWHQFFLEEKFRVCNEPVLDNGKKPEFLLYTKYGDFLFEVITSFDEKTLYKKKKITEEILGKTSEISHHFRISLSLDKWFGHDFKSSLFLKFVVNQLDLLLLARNQNQEKFEPITYRQKDYVIEIDISSFQEKRGKILAGVSYPGYSGTLGSKQIKSRLQKKITNYKNVVDLKKPLVVAVCNDNSNSFIGNSVEYDLFGRPTVHFSIDGSGKSYWGRDNSGIFMQRNADRSPRNTRLSAVIQCARKWGKTKKYKNGSYIYDMAVYHNPFAAFPISKNVFSKFAQYIPHQTKTGGVMKWRNKKENRYIVF